MIIEEKGLVKAIKAAYRHSGYTVLNQGGEVTIYTEGWFVRCLWTKLPRKALAIIVEHMGMIPDDGEAMAIEKDDQPQAVMAGIVSDDVAGWMGGEAASMASYVPVTFRGYQLFQEVNGRQAYGVDPTALAIVERATAEMGTAAISGGRALAWSHDGETVMLGAIRKPHGRGSGSGLCGRPWRAWTCTRGRADTMTEFERITVSPAALGAFLSSLPCLEGPWDDAFHREFCGKCAAENCDACPHEAERNNPAWWLELIHTGTGPVRTESRNPYRKQAADLRLEAMHQRDRFGHDMLAKELESAAASIEDLTDRTEGAENETD